jgi:hypothetical protein
VQAAGDGEVVQPIHSQVVDAMIARIRALADTPFPVRFSSQRSGDAVLRGINGAQWNVSFTPVIDRTHSRRRRLLFLGRESRRHRHMPAGDPGRMMGLQRALACISKRFLPKGRASG